MAKQQKFIVQLRRGVKETDANGNVTRDDWAEYTVTKPIESIPVAGELVLEYDNGIPRLKIGNGVDPFAKLPYMSVDSFLFPTPTTITLYGGADHWKPVEGFLDRYTQDITSQLAGKITANSKVDLQPTPEQLHAFYEKDLTFTTVNEDGNVRVCAIGVMPQNTYENIQVIITEVVDNG